MKKTKYDIIIVGAGPGGLRCAQVLGLAGKSVLIVDKKDIIGPKVCAGGLTRKSIAYFFELGLPENIIERKFSKIVFRKGNLKTEINFGEAFVYTICRERLGQWQLGEIEKIAGVKIKTGTSVAQVSESHVLINDEQISFEYLIGADGSNSIIRNYLGIVTKKFGVAFQYFIPQKQDRYDDIEIILDKKLFHAWYAWIFPYEDKVSVGSGYFPRLTSAKESIANFEQWTKEDGIDISESKFEAHPINCDYRGFEFGNKFLIGDAAGFASAFTGEGIYQAVISGDEVARRILDSKYECPQIKKILHEKKIQEFLLLFIILSGPFKNLVFYMVVFAVRINFLGKLLLRILS